MLSMGDELRTALGLEDSEDPASAIELARQAWAPYFSYIEPGVISEECAYAKMLDALICVGNVLYYDDEEMFEAAAEAVTLRPENLDLKLTKEMGASYLEAARITAHKHRRNVVDLLLTLGLLYSQEKNRTHLHEWEIARDRFGMFDQMTLHLNDAERERPTREGICKMYGDVLVLGPRMEDFGDTLSHAREHLERLELLAKARLATYAALVHATRAAWWMDEHRG